MGIDDLAGKAKDLLGDHADKVNDAIDGVADKVKEKTPDQLDGLVDQAPRRPRSRSRVRPAPDLAQGPTGPTAARRSGCPATCQVEGQPDARPGTGPTS